MFSLGDLYLNVTTVLVALTTLAAFGLYKSSKKPDGFPPGPTPLPIVGNILSFISKKSALEVLADLHKKYGDIFSLRFATRNVIVLNSIGVIKEALLKKAVLFAGRPQIYSVEIFTEGYKDIVFTNYGAQWQYQRKLAHTAVRHYARKEELEKLVFSVTPEIAKVIDGLEGKPFAPKYSIGQAVYNILATMCFGKQYKFNDPDLLHFINSNAEMLKAFGNGLPADYFPLLQYVPISSEKKLRKAFQDIMSLFYNEFERHREQFDPENIRDFFDKLMLTQKEAIEAGEEGAKTLTNTHLVQTVSDLFGAGTETTTLTLHWTVAIMAEFPNIQDKVAKEIDEIIGQDRLPSLDDKGHLPYTEATILEVFRFGTVAPMGVPHAVLDDTTLCGYNIPKGTMVMINHLALHNDPNVWDQPEQFKPERFLDDNGQLLSKLPESFLPFSCGRRVCLGEDFAKKEIFLLFTWLLSRYSFYKVPGKEDESLLKLTDISGMVHQLPDEIEVCVKKRF